MSQPVPDVTPPPLPDAVGTWLITRLHAERDERDRARLAALLAAHPLPHQQR